jgi:hypothetical protein
MRWAGNVARIEDKIYASGVLVGKPDERDRWEDIDVDGKIILKWILVKKR